MIDAASGPLQWWPRHAPGARPALLGAVFWASVAVTVGVHLTPTPGLVFGPPWVLAALAGTAAGWAVLPWNADGPRRLRAAFLAATVALVTVDGTGASVPVMLLALVNVGLLHRIRVGVAAAAAVLGTLVLAMVVVYDRSVAAAALQGVGIAVAVAFVMAVATAARRARLAQADGARLSAELAAANRGLQQYAARVRELTAAEERTRMARDLHDSIGHHLTVIKVELENAERYRHRDAATAWAEVRQAKTVAVDALHEVRRWVRATRPPLLEVQRGSAALRALARSFDGVGVTVDVSVDGEERPLDAAREVVLFRALQEAMTNALKHSGACLVRARLAFEPGAVSLAVVDDGRGCAGAPPGFGLASLAERVGGVGGAFRSGDAPDGGFAVHLRLPDAA